MRLLVDFLCRFGWGLSAALVITPAALVPAGFFRVNMLVVLGLATFAALLCGQAGTLLGWIWMLPAAAALAAWIGSIAWYAERCRAGSLCCAACAVFLAIATALVARAGSTGPAAVPLSLLSGLVTGLTVHAMLLGHWYLNAPGMRVDVLRRMIDAALAAWAVQLAATLATAALHPGDPLSPAGLVTAATSAPPGGHTGVALLWLRWLAGLVGLPVLLRLARETLKIPNTQSATGILYVACLAAILGELTAQLLYAAS